MIFNFKSYCNLKFNLFQIIKKLGTQPMELSFVLSDQGKSLEATDVVATMNKVSKATMENILNAKVKITIRLNGIRKQIKFPLL